MNPLRALPPLLLAALVCAQGVAAHEPAHAGLHEPPAASPAEPQAAVRLVDRRLVDQDARELHFVGEALGDRIVAMTFVFTSCSTACPVISSIFAQVQDRLSEALDEDFVLLSLSLDPWSDTPARLKAQAEIHGSGPGWRWLTGNPDDVADVLRGLGAYSADFSSHGPMVLIGDAQHGGWSRMYGFVSPDEIVARMQALRAARGQVAEGQP
jgi:protein SCO1